ncbi:MAG: thiamine pyrophosphate-dependent dehydrogenase E1 component subunit alpha [Myxococcota bacterium]|nr:thiamine pyrophosphate-dependent dehydrogenase E1 component subunit alpha [Myxococcota bacterium]
MADITHTSPSGFPPATLSSARMRPEPLPAELLLRMHERMVEGRALEERLIRMQRGGDGYFWIGGPGEEAFNVALGLQVHKGQGIAHDYLHLHYRSSATLLAMGSDPIDALRQMKNVATDPYSGGRNFCGHSSIREWNVAPITSPIEVQYSVAIGTAIAQKRAGGEGITIVQGGDAGTAEGDFATCLVWASRPGFELPMLIIVTNNGWGISTPQHEQHGEQHVADRGKAFGMRTATIDGNDPESAYRGIEEAMRYVRRERKPFLLEAYVSRLYGHSSSSGSNLVDSETDCLAEIERRLAARGLRSADESAAIRTKYEEHLLEAAKTVALEPKPEAASIWEHVFAERDLVGEGARRVPHDNRVWRAQGCTFPTAKAAAVAKNGGPHGNGNGNGNGGAH